MPAEQTLMGSDSRTILQQQQQLERLTKEGEVGEGEQVEQQKPEEFACRSSTHLLTT